MNRRFPHIALRSGTTLIEVLAGLVILSTLLVALAIARGRFLRQWAQADHRIAAAHAADHLLETWLSGSPQAVPISAFGTTDDGKNDVWSTQVLSSPAAESVGAIIVRLKVLDPSVNQTLSSIDFVLRDPRSPARATTADGK